MITLRHRRIACSNTRWTVYFDDVTDSQGRSVNDYLVLTSKDERESFLAGSAVVPVINGQIGLLNNYRHCVERNCLEVVKGFIDLGETPVQAAHRELIEEIGYSCPPGRMMDLGTFLPESGAMRARGALFVALDCVPSPGLDESEFGLSRLALYAPADVYRMALDGEIEDSATLIALFRAQRWLVPGAK